MGVINKIREKTGLVIGLVAFSLILFLLGADFFSPTTGIFGQKNSDVIAEIDGQKVKVGEYNNQVDKITYNYRLQAQKEPDENTRRSIKQQAWSNLINDIAYKNQYELLGISVSDRELKDMVQGVNIAPEVRSSFTDPNTNTFNKETVIRTLQSIANAPEERQIAWQEFEQELSKSRERTKYMNLLSTTSYATKVEAEHENMKATAKVDLKYVYVPFRSILDSTVKVSEQELKTFLADHAVEYQKKASRDIKYVAFPIKPSNDDIAVLREEMDKIKRQFEEATSDSIFAAVNSDKDNYYAPYSADALPPSLKTEDLEIGKVYGPYKVALEHQLYKVTDINDNGNAVARASHILFKWDSEDDKAATKQEARKILAKIRGGDDFSEMARIHGTDGTASKGGDLGYFGEGQMVSEFQEAVFNAKREGLLRDVVETQFGYHIIDVTSVKSNTQFIISSVIQDIYPSDETKNAIYRRAELFASKCNSLDELISSAKEEKITVKEAKELASTSQQVAGLNDSRRIVTWAYRDTEIGDVSEVFELDSKYVIAGLSEIQKEGVSNLSTAKLDIERRLKNDKKAEIIMKKLSSMSGSIDEIKSAYGNDAQVNEMSGLALSSNSINVVGYAPEAVGAIFALKEGEKTAPIKTDNGVIVAEIVSKAEGQDLADVEGAKKQLSDKRKGTATYGIRNVIEEFADIEDNRYKFF